LVVSTRFLNMGSVCPCGAAHRRASGLTTDPIAHAVAVLIPTAAEVVPGITARLVFMLDRLTLPLGRALSPQEASSLVQTTVGERP
jgi:hypothetical protein